MVLMNTMDNMSIIDDVLTIYNINSAIQTLEITIQFDGLHDGDIPSNMVDVFTRKRVLHTHKHNQNKEVDIKYALTVVHGQ